MLGRGFPGLPADLGLPVLPGLPPTAHTQASKEWTYQLPSNPGWTGDCLGPRSFQSHACLIATGLLENTFQNIITCLGLLQMSCPVWHVASRQRSAPAPALAHCPNG